MGALGRPFPTRPTCTRTRHATRPSTRRRNALELAHALSSRPSSSRTFIETRMLGRLWPVSALTLGGGGVGQLWGPTTRDECIATVRTAVDCGITLLDMFSNASPLPRLAHSSPPSWRGSTPPSRHDRLRCWRAKPRWHRRDGDPGAQVLRVGRDGEQRLGRGFEHQVVDHRLVGVPNSAPARSRSASAPDRARQRSRCFHLLGRCRKLRQRQLLTGIGAFDLGR